MFLFFYGVFFIFDKLKQNNLEKENKWNKTNQWENEIEQLHAIIRKTSLLETTKWGGSVYTHKNKNVVGNGGFKLVLFLYTDNHDKDYIHNTIKLIHKDDNIFNFYKKNIKLKLKDNFNKIDTAKGLTNHIITNMPVYETFDELIKDELVITNVIDKLVNETEE